MFPRMVVPLLVGRPASIGAIDEALTSGRALFCVTQRDPNSDSPDKGELHEIGVACNILQTLRMPDETLKVTLESIWRGRLHEYMERDRFAEAEVEQVLEDDSGDDDVKAAMRVAKDHFEEYARSTQRISPEIVASLETVQEAPLLADLMCAHLPFAVDERQELLDTLPVTERLERICALLSRENHLQTIERDVRDRVREQMERGQREYYLQEQLKAIHQELGQGDDDQDEFSEIVKAIKKCGMPKEVREKAMREVSRYQRMPSMSPEGTVVRSYLEWLVDMPWKKRSKDRIDLVKARAQLDKDHYGLDKVKDRILEFLAVRKLSKSTKGPILCLVGPPGVGKTSLGQSIAEAMGRKFVRVSLGGVRDEAEIRGHRRTYIGALPGRIIQSLKKAGVKNPVFMLDELDKMNMDFRGDPASALLEVLDPEQNTKFSDHYLEVDFDLHEIFFIATANDEYEIPHALHDRMEVVNLSGYTPFEKEQIANLFLIPKHTSESGLTKKHIRFTKEGIHTVIDKYTREAGVRDLERRVAQICRKVARRVVEGTKTKKPIEISPAMVRELLGPDEYIDMEAEKAPSRGVAVGLAWTSTGGELLLVETSIMRGKGDLMLTGQLGEVMRESAQAAYTYLRSHAADLGISPNFCKDKDIHLHVPEGAIPKDGPSAGIPLTVSMLSALRGKEPKESIAATGEITLRGRVLAVGGIKEKLLAAHRAGIKRVIMPVQNEKDLVDIPKEVREALDIVFVEDLETAIAEMMPPVKKPAKRRAKKKGTPKPKTKTKRNPKRKIKTRT